MRKLVDVWRDISCNTLLLNVSAVVEFKVVRMTTLQVFVDNQNDINQTPLSKKTPESDSNNLIRGTQILRKDWYLMHSGVDYTKSSRILSAYMWVTMREAPSAARLQVTPSHASQSVGAQGSPFHPNLEGTFNVSLNACIAAAVQSECQMVSAIFPPTQELPIHSLVLLEKQHQRWYASLIRVATNT